MQGIRVVILFFVIVFVMVSAKKFDTRCKLVREFTKVGRMPVTIFLGHWVCLVDQVNAQRDTSLVTRSKNIKSYGLYQISGKYCKEGRLGGECNMKCESLLDDDILDDTDCARHIFHTVGFRFWRLWDLRCNNKDKRQWYIDEIYKCPEFIA